jgi:membrane-associated protease RseP (regulator of RpoE activity)
MDVRRYRMNARSGLSGCQVAGILLAVLLVATVCLATGLVLGGGIGLVGGGTAGYAIGRARSTRIEPHIEIPIPQPPGDEGWQLPEELPELPLPGVELRPFLGVRYKTVKDGARIAEVEPGTPAQAAGLRPGDVILAVDGAPVGEGHPDLTARVLEYEPGDEIQLRVRRGAGELEIEVILGARAVFDRRFDLPPGEFPELPQRRQPSQG